MRLDSNIKSKLSNDACLHMQDLDKSCKKGTYLNILDMMKSPEKGDSSGHLHTWAQLHVAELSRTHRPVKTMLNKIINIKH